MMEGFDALSALFVFTVAVFLPYLVVKSARRIGTGKIVPNRKQIWLNSIVMQMIFLAFALFVARERGVPVFAPGRIDARGVVAAAVLLVLALGSMPLRWRLTPEAEKRRVLGSRPAQASDLGLWLAVSLAAGFVEEIVYRGVLFAILIRWTDGWEIAVVLCVAAFVMGHAGRGWQRLVVIGGLAFGCHVLVALTGTLYLAMAVHFLYDFLAGVIYLGWARHLRISVTATETH